MTESAKEAINFNLQFLSNSTGLEPIEEAELDLFFTDKLTEQKSYLEASYYIFLLRANTDIVPIQGQNNYRIKARNLGIKDFPTMFNENIHNNRDLKSFFMLGKGYE